MTVVAISKSHRKTLQERVRELMDRDGISQADLANETGVSRSTISEWLRGNYKHAGTVVPALQAWIDRRSRTAIGGAFIELKASKLVFEICRWALAHRAIVAIVGRPGLGKTVALEEFHRRALHANQELIYHMTSPAIKPSSLTQMMCRRFELSERGSAHARLESIVRHLRRHPTPIILDEANHLNVLCLEYLRYIHDAVGIPLVLCGSIKLQRTLSESSDKHEELEQLQSRIGRKVVLQPMELGETKLYVEQHLGEISIEVAKEFKRCSRGVARDLSNGIETVRALMERNSLDVLTPEVVETAYQHQLVVG